MLQENINREIVQIRTLVPDHKKSKACRPRGETRGKPFLCQHLHNYKIYNIDLLHNF